MTYQEKIGCELRDPTRIILYAEGSFYRVYFRSCLTFVENVKRYQVNWKWIKTIEQNVPSIGFPISAATKVLDGLDYQIKDDQSIEIQMPLVDFDKYAQFVEAALTEDLEKQKLDKRIEESEKILTANQEETEKIYEQRLDKTIEDDLKRFDLANATPIECMNMMAKLKSMII